MTVTLADRPATWSPPADIAALPAGSEITRRRPGALASPLPTDRLRGWIVTALVGAIAAVTRFWALGWPRTKSFDEVYYATEAQEMLRYGYEDNRGYMFIVHPPLGKWLIAAGSAIFGDNSWGWRVVPALAGVICVVLTVRIGRRMFGSTLLGAIAGLLLAVDGLSVVQSRVALLDIFMPLFLLAGFAALLVDRDQFRTRLARLVDAGVDLGQAVPAMGPRPWRLIAGVALGLSLSIKWSSLTFVVGMALLSFWWDRGALRAAGARNYRLAALRRSWLTGIVSLGVVPLATYLFTWIGWFVGENSWNRHWGETNNGYGFTKTYLPSVIADHLPAAVRSLIQYHLQAKQFHDTLTSSHPYESSPWSWLVLGRPVSYYYPTDPTGCGADKCARAILMIGTPALWWAFVPVMLWLLWHLATTRDWRAGSLWIMFLAGWAFWLQYPDRTKFLFYMTPLVPFLVLAVTMALGSFLRWDRLRIAAAERREEELLAQIAARQAAGTLTGEPEDEEPDLLPPLPVRWGAIGVAGYLGLVVANFAWLWPILTGGLLTHDQWYARMWFQSWI